jgi:phenylpropionate dioxygenase-like ring-hydroxylating dioxygenase large terminal subunit
MQLPAKPFENQWYVIALSEELGRGKKAARKIYGQDIVIWRKADDSLGAIDARCPHMGASLAVGRVVDDAVECPYHGFRYDETGKCIETPLRKPEALIPRTLCNRSYAIREQHGWIFLFWGEPAEAPDDIPWFDEVREPLSHAWSMREWPVSFTRFIENTVDVAHLGTVHRGTLSWTIPEFINVRCKVEGNVISMMPPSSTDLPVASKIIYPNLALLYLHPKFLTVFAAVPIDDEHSRIYVRSSQAVIRWPVIGWLFSKIKHWADMAALWQDKQALFSVRPIKIEDAKHEVLMDFDPHVVEYRKMRLRELERVAADTPPPRAAAG